MAQWHIITHISIYLILTVVTLYTVYDVLP